MFRYAPYFTFLIALVIVISSCGEVDELLPEAPIDIHIKSGPQEAEVIDAPMATFTWEGSNNLVKEFSYRLVPLQQEWSQWSSDMSKTFEKLDEESYTFEIKGRYEPGKEIAAPVRRHFSVDIPHDLILMVQSDKPVYTLGETASLTVTLRNISPDSFRICVLVSPWYRIRVREKSTGYETLTDLPSGVANPRNITLAPNEEDVYETTWNLRLSGFPFEDYVPPGVYQVTPEIITGGGCNPTFVFPHIESYPISITIVDR
jgi:hypothetical protein